MTPKCRWFVVCTPELHHVLYEFLYDFTKEMLILRVNMPSKSSLRCDFVVFCTYTHSAFSEDIIPKSVLEAFPNKDMQGLSIFNAASFYKK